MKQKRISRRMLIAGAAQAPAHEASTLPTSRTRVPRAGYEVVDRWASSRKRRGRHVLDAATLRELPLAWEAFRADDSLRVAIFTAAGDKAFCGGVDITSIRSAPPPTYLKRDEGARSYTAKQNKCWKPVIAAINGFVAGPGLHFVLDADICIAVPEATFFDVHMHRTGSVPVFEPIELARKIPAEAVSRMFLLGPHDPLTARRATELGLISEIVPRDGLMARAMELAQQVAQRHASDHAVSRRSTRRANWASRRRSTGG